MLEILQYGFVFRAIEAGLIVGFLAPLIGTFLVLRRYSLIADTLAHVSLAGIALGLLLGLSPIYTALGVTVASSLGIDRLRATKHVYGESALALFLSGSLALATVLLSLGRGFNANVFNYLFGSIVTVTQRDVYTMAVVAVIVVVALFLFYKELVYVTFDEECARVAGIPVQRINTLLMVLSALTISLAIPVVGVLLIAALIVVPVVAALLLRQSFTKTIVYAEAISLFSVIAGIWASFYLNLATGGTIVLIMLGIFLVMLVCRPRLTASLDTSR
jgi:zinc transport system permease protein